MAYCVLMIMVTVMVEKTMLTVSALVLCAKNYAGHFPFSGPVNLMKSQPNAVSTSFPIFVVLRTQSPTAGINRRKGAEAVRIQNPHFHLHVAHRQSRLSPSASSSGGGGTSACYPVLHPSCVIMWLDFLSWNKCSRCQFNEKFCSMLPGLH